MLKKVLFHNQNKTQLFLSMLGALLGFTFLITSVHYYIQIKDYGKNEEILDDSSLIIQKKVSTLSSLNLVKSEFSRGDISTISSQDFIEAVDPILNNNFDITIQTDSDLVPYFRSDIFVQSVNADFIGLQELFWNWDQGSEYVPVVLPRDFLVMLNTFANAKGLPQVSEDLAKSIGFKFVISNRQKKEDFKVKIVGFTSKVSSILVPPSFMDYGNKQFASSEDEKATQIIVSVKKGKFGEFENYINSRGLESKESSVLIGKMQSIGLILFSILIGIGFITIFLAGLILIQYTQLIISRNQYEIQTLMRIGYSSKTITKVIIQYFIKQFVVVAGISFILFTFIKHYVNSLFIKSGLFLAEGYTVNSILVLILTLAVILSANYFKTKKEVEKY